MRSVAAHPSPSVNAAGVRLVGVSQRFDAATTVLSDFSITVAPGEFLAILGPSGSGKSTLLRLIAGLDGPTQGDVTVEAADAPGRPTTAYVFQDAHLLPWRDVMRNVELPLELQGVPTSERHYAALAALEQVGLLDAAQKYPNQLSGGMRMRASLARSLVIAPQLLLLDEPFAALDEITRHRLDEQLRALWLRRRMTTIFVTHSTTEAAFLAERAIVLSAKPARILEDRRIALPVERDAMLRGTPQFAAETRVLFEALERGTAVAR